MKNKFQFLIAFLLINVFLFYRDNAVIAIAAEQNIVSGTESNPEEAAEPAAEQRPEEAAEQCPEEAADPAAEQCPEEVADPAVEQRPEEAADPAAEQRPEEAADPEQAMDSVSTGDALIEWLESHKNTGGSVKLTDHVTLNGIYSICPDGMRMPDVTVDTGQYTITIAGEIEFLSDDHFIFTGQPEDGSIFYVAHQGSLSMSGVVVESGQCALWQEEGAGLIIDNCRISGDIHYADTPFVMDYYSVCVVVEKNQTLQDVLPSSIDCIVNRRGGTGGYEPVPVSWNLAGTEKQQEQRRRLLLQGSFVQAASAEAVLCTAAYNDYPLTITEVRATTTGSMYMFQGFYTKPEEALPITVMAEYSFDGVNWYMDEEKSVTHVDDTFLIAFPAKQCDMEADPHIYIRLRGDDNGIEYLSNVLRYTADNLDYAEDIGGSRGGGTSIINPPDPPEQNDTSQKEDSTQQNDPPKQDDADQSSEEQPVQSPERDTAAGAGGSVSSSGTPRPADGTGSTGSNAAGVGQMSKAERPLHTAADRESGQSLHTESNAEAGKSLYAESSNTDKAQQLFEEAEADGQEEANRSDSTASEKEETTVDAVSVYAENNEHPAKGYARTPHGGSLIVLAAGIVLLSVIVGTLGFCVHTRRRAG